MLAKLSISTFVSVLLATVILPQPSLAQNATYEEACRIRDTGELLDAFTVFSDVLKERSSPELMASALVNQVAISVVTINMLQHMINKYKKDLGTESLTESQTRALRNRIRGVEDGEVMWAKTLMNGYSIYLSEYSEYTKNMSSPFIDLSGVEEERQVQIQAMLFNQVFGVPRADNKLNVDSFHYSVGICFESIGHWEGAEDIYEALIDGGTGGIGGFYRDNAQVRLAEVKKQNPSFLNSLWSGIGRASEMIEWFAYDYAVDAKELGDVRNVIAEIKKNQDVLQFIAMLVDSGNERAIGEYAENELKSQFSISDNARLSRIGSELLRGLGGSEYNYVFRVIETDELNAYALPGGFVYITSGLLQMIENQADSDDMIAFVLGHEISHVERRHCFQEMKRRMGQRAYSEFIGLVKAGNSASILEDLGGFALGLCRYGYSRGDEYEADILGVGMSVAAGYDGASAVDVLKLLSAYENEAIHILLRTHPPINDRIKRIRAAIG